MTEKINALEREAAAKEMKEKDESMTDKVASKLSVTGFSGKDLGGKSDGMAKMYARLLVTMYVRRRNL